MAECDQGWPTVAKGDRVCPLSKNHCTAIRMSARMPSAYAPRVRELRVVVHGGFVKAEELDLAHLGLLTAVDEQLLQRGERLEYR